MDNINVNTKRVNVNGVFWPSIWANTRAWSAPMSQWSRRGVRGAPSDYSGHREVSL
jgi:hypothetical protein